jgi:hypothetical protein
MKTHYKKNNNNKIGFLKQQITAVKNKNVGQCL